MDISNYFRLRNSLKSRSRPLSRSELRLQQKINDSDMNSDLANIVLRIILLNFSQTFLVFFFDFFLYSSFIFLIRQFPFSKALFNGFTFIFYSQCTRRETQTLLRSSSLIFTSLSPCDEIIWLLFCSSNL